jgi:hypothetical protein
MAEVKRLVCLANSRKLSGRCVAGMEVVDGAKMGWVRPVSAREHQEVSEHERQYPDGSDPRVLDVVLVPLIEPRPSSYQQENWLLDPELYWEKVDRIGWEDLVTLADPTAPLWVDGPSTHNGQNDVITLAEAEELTSSLRLLYVSDLKLSVFAPGSAFGNPKRRVQGRFSYNGIQYWLWVTDPDYEKAYLSQANGDYEIGEAYLTVSLGEPFDGRCYKLIATIIQPQRASSE